MGWYRVVKTVKGHRYLYEQRSWREGKKVRTESRYIGPADEHTGTSTPVITTKVGSAGLYDTKVYRASNRPFTNKNFKDDDALGKVMFFGDRPEIAKMYGAHVQDAYVTIKKPFIISEKTPDDIGQVALVAQYGGVKKFREALKKEGYDGIVIEKGYGKEILPFDESQIRVAQQPAAQVAYCDPSDISSMGRIKTGSLEKVFDRIPDGTTEPRGFFVKKNGKIWPTEKATPDILKRSMIDLNPDGSLREGCFMYSKIAFTEDVALERGRKE